jgi:hypothetical protein
LRRASGAPINLSNEGGVKPMTAIAEKKPVGPIRVEIPESGYVLIVFREGFKSTEVHGRYAGNVVEEAKRRQEAREDVTRVEVEIAASFQREAEEAPPRKRAHDEWGFPINVMQFPLITNRSELDTK